MLPIVSIVGRAGSGKTTLLEGLIPELKRRGYRVALIKHAVHGFEIDKPGKDSWRLTQAGSDLTVLSSPQPEGNCENEKERRKVVLIRSVEHEYSLDELSHLIGHDFDIVLTDGFKQDKAPKIEVHRHGMGELVCLASTSIADKELFAVATDEPLDIAVPQLALDDFSGIADLVEQRFLSGDRKEEVSLLINGLPVPLNLFVGEIFSRILTAMVSTLKGIDMDKVNSVDISCRKGERLHHASMPSDVECASCEKCQTRKS